MKKNYACLGLTLTALGAASCCANATYLNQGGMGEVLVYPYYTVNGGNSTVLTVFNSTGNGKAVKVRILEGYDGRDVLDFNLYLSPYDGWVGQTLPTAAGGAAIFTNDNSCTVPALSSLSSSPSAFTTANFDGTGVPGNDGGPLGPNRTAEGHIEIIEMGIVTNASAHQSLNAVSHVNGVPVNCAQLIQAWDPTAGGYWVADPTIDIGPASGGLFGSGTIVNVPQGTVQSYNAEAIAQFYPQGALGIHSGPSSQTPNIGSATSTTATVFADDVPVILTFARGIDAVSAVFMADQVNNEFFTLNSIGAASEWVVTYPTKRFYVDPSIVGAKALPPFDAVFGANAQSTSTSFSNVQVQVRNREEASLIQPCPGGVCASYKPAPGLSYESQVVTFNQGPATTDPTSVFASNSPSKIVASSLVSFNINTAVGVGTTSTNSGWATIDLSADFADNYHELSSTDGRLLIGQPVTGFWLSQFVNGNLGGVLANYTAAYRHKTHSHCMKADSSPC